MQARILVISPIPSHPQNQGNSARINAICRFLQSQGHLVHFLYYPLEGLSPQQRADMSAAWDHFHTMPCDLPNTGKTMGQFFGIDDWYDPRLGDMVAQLHARWQFDIAIVNYVWFSAPLDSLPDSVLKVIDTHDVFGDRHKRFEEIGLAPEWFYTTLDEERRGLQRAHAVIAIQDEEEAYFRQLLAGSATQVATVGHIIPPRFLPERAVSDWPVVGYLGSGNPFNVAAMREFAAKLVGFPGLTGRFRFVMAGTITERLPALPPFENLGTVSDLDDFYRGVDIVINPMSGGTGLKIKTLEALSYGVAIAGTESALVGIEPRRSNAMKQDRVGAKLMAAFPRGSVYLTASDARATLMPYLKTQADALVQLFQDA